MSLASAAPRPAALVPTTTAAADGPIPSRLPIPVAAGPAVVVPVTTTAPTPIARPVLPITSYSSAPVRETTTGEARALAREVVETKPLVVITLPIPSETTNQVPMSSSPLPRTLISQPVLRLRSSSLAEMSSPPVPSAPDAVVATLRDNQVEETATSAGHATAAGPSQPELPSGEVDEPLDELDPLGNYHFLNISPLGAAAGTPPTSPKTPAFRSAPSSPISPTRSLESFTDFQSPATAGDTPDCNNEKRRKVKRQELRRVILASEFHEHSTSGEWDSLAIRTPPPTAQACSALQVFTPDGNLYLAKSTTGSVPINRIAEKDLSEENPDDDEVERTTNPELPGTSSEQRQLQTKQRNEERRQRQQKVAAAAAPYPQEKTGKGKGVKNNPAPNGNQSEPKKPTTKRGPDGRFIKS